MFNPAFWCGSAHLAEAVAQSVRTLFVFWLVIGCGYLVFVWLVVEVGKL